MQSPCFISPRFVTTTCRVALWVNYSTHHWRWRFSNLAGFTVDNTHRNSQTDQCLILDPLLQSSSKSTQDVQSRAFVALWSSGNHLEERWLRKNFFSFTYIIQSLLKCIRQTLMIFQITFYPLLWFDKAIAFALSGLANFRFTIRIHSNSHYCFSRPSWFVVCFNKLTSEWIDDWNIFSSTPTPLNKIHSSETGGFEWCWCRKRRKIWIEMILCDMWREKANKFIAQWLTWSLCGPTDRLATLSSRYFYMSLGSQNSRLTCFVLFRFR